MDSADVEHIQRCIIIIIIIIIIVIIIVIIVIISFLGHTEKIRMLLANERININHQSVKGTITSRRHHHHHHHHYCIGSTAISLACENGHVSIVDLLLRRADIDVNILTVDNYTGFIIIIIIIIIIIVVVIVITIIVIIALHWATVKGHTDICKLLLAVPDIDINVTNNRGNTPLILAGTTTTLLLLLQCYYYHHYH